MMKWFRKSTQHTHSETIAMPTSEESIHIAARNTQGLYKASNVMEQSGYLAGQMLVATPVIDSGSFQRSVVYLFAHSSEGAMGLMINHPLETINITTLIESASDALAAPHILPTYFGGPVERMRGFVLHTNDYLRKEGVPDRVQPLAVSTSSSILSDIVAGKGPSSAALVVGCAAWDAGQLEAEIEANSWITVPATPELVFHTENELKWATASKSLGIDMAFYSTTIGHA